MSKYKTCPKTIAKNKRVFYDYNILEKFESGIVLKGWEVKSIRSGKVQMIDSHIHIKNSEAWLFKCIITPLLSASTHVIYNSSAERKLLLNRHEINKIMGKIKQKGLTCIPINMYFKQARVKIEIALAQGKKIHDKRQDQKNKDWAREKNKIIKRIRNN